jgi:hypothetical protein
MRQLHASFRLVAQDVRKDLDTVCRWIVCRFLPGQIINFTSSLSMLQAQTTKLSPVCPCRVKIASLARETIIEILSGLPEQHAPLVWAEADGWQGVPANSAPNEAHPVRASSNTMSAASGQPANQVRQSSNLQLDFMSKSSGSVWQCQMFWRTFTSK